MAGDDANASNEVRKLSLLSMLSLEMWPSFESVDSSNGLVVCIVVVRYDVSLRGVCSV